MEHTPNLNQSDVYRLKVMLRDMSIHGLYRLAAEYQVEIPMDALDVFSIVDSIIESLKPAQQEDLLKKYGDAGRKSTYLYISKDKTPALPKLYNKANDLLFIKNDSGIWENYPYYDQVEIDDSNDVLKIRFHYLHGSTVTLDEDGKQHEQRYKYSGVAVYRKDSRILEVRALHKGIADKIATNTPVQIGLPPFVSVDLMDEKLITCFVEWINSLNSANIELASDDSVAGSLRITARRGMDLKTAEKFAKELKNGQLRGGHVTIEHEQVGVNFRINFRDCHITYTLFTSETDMTYVLRAIEKIMEGYNFAKPKRMLHEFFDQPN
jgi:hypothetical protein